MNIQELLKIGAQAFQSGVADQITGSLSLDTIMDALAGLLPGKGRNVDLASLVGRMQGGGLAAMAETWLGDGGNAGIDAGQLVELFGRDSIRSFAGKLGLDEGTALSGLQEAVPTMVDRASSGGSLESIGGLSGAIGLAGKLFGR
ncbi:DUF937 domain-containing protein [Wenzhouxiangella sp. XN79A]|uniref:YidB family protein n=1 Tax=Wenzhouxiangella sp. XN79A TaxID=2724193 RepID=UPI00144AA248|nr:YidB family protein [Wenzhouxiangella sp. XN79A]NKI36231.1 DUF937 domain-containing protein [Wenzhouxiangella sp. XN79A]